MAKGKSRGSSADATPLSTPSSLTELLVPQTTISPLVELNPPALSDPVMVRQLYHGRYTSEPLYDRRRHQPTDYPQSPGSTYARATRLHVGGFSPLSRSTREDDIPAGLRFAIPSHIAVCVRRKVRREVLHALDRTSKRGRGGGKRHRNFWSGIKC